MKKKARTKVSAVVMTFAIAVSAVSGGACFSSTVSAESNEQIIYNFLINEVGLNSAAACGVLANIEKESNFRNDIIEGGYTWASGGGYGICQWTNSPRTSYSGRRTNLVKWCTKNGYDYQTLTGQLRFLKHELETTYRSSVYNYLKNVSDDITGAYNAGYRWCYSFEVPAGYNTGVSVNRGNLAKREYLTRYRLRASSTTSLPELSSDTYYKNLMPLTAYINSDKNAATYAQDCLTVTGSISPDDECTILEVYTNGFCKVRYPLTGGGTKTAYAPITAFLCSAKKALTPKIAPEPIKTYTRSDAKTEMDGIDKGDPCYEVGNTGSVMQVIYPTVSGKKLGWTAAADWNYVPDIKPAENAKGLETDFDDITFDSEPPTVTSDENEPVTEAAVTSEALYGDVNGDSSVDMKDAAALRKYLAGSGENINSKNADMNMDGTINMQDVLLIKKAASADSDSADKVVYSTFTYGQSEEGRNLVCRSIAPEKYDRTVLLTFELHGYEDDHDADGQILVDTADYLTDYYRNHGGLKCRLLIVPSANPDGLLDGTTNNGFGRCNANGTDLNRDFNANYTPNTIPGRNFTPSAFSASESRALRDLVNKYQPDTVLDFHGWLNRTIGDPELAEVFDAEMGLPHQTGFTSNNANGYFANWTHRQGSRSLVVEFGDTEIDRAGLVKAIDRIVGGSYDNGKGAFTPDPEFSEFGSISGYTLTSGRTDTYRSFDTPFSEASYIDGKTDLCSIQKVYANGWVKAEYPVPGGTKTGFCRLSDFIEPETAVKHYKARVFADTAVYIRSDKEEMTDVIWDTTQFTVVARKDSMVQIIYTLDNGSHKIGWIDKSMLR